MLPINNTNTTDTRYQAHRHTHTQLTSQNTCVRVCIQMISQNYIYIYIYSSFAIYFFCRVVYDLYFGLFIFCSLSFWNHFPFYFHFCFRFPHGRRGWEGGGAGVKRALWKLPLKKINWQIAKRIAHQAIIGRWRVNHPAPQGERNKKKMKINKKKKQNQTSFLLFYDNKRQRRLIIFSCFKKKKKKNL